MRGAPHGTVRSDSRWLAALADPRARVEVELFGYYHLDGWHIPERSLPEHLLYYLVRGAFRGVFSWGTERFAGPGLFWLPPGVTHELFQEPGAGKMVLYNYRFRIIGGRRSVGFAGRRPLFASDPARLGPLAEQLHDDIRREHPMRDRRLASLIFLLYSELAAAGKRDAARGPQLDEAARRKLLHYAAARAAQRPTPAELAGVLRLSPDYFSRVFRRTFGVSPRSWLVRERIGQAAVRLLDAPQLTVSEIAYEFGYEDIFLFSRQFKQVTGRSPRQHRARARARRR
jgi:AraC-like DNA-binding protein